MGIEVGVEVGLISACCVVGSDAPHATRITTQQRVIIAAIGRFMPLNLSVCKNYVIVVKYIASSTSSTHIYVTNSYGCNACNGHRDKQ